MGTKKGYAYIIAGIVLFLMSSLGSANEGPSGEPAWVYVVPWWIAGAALIMFGARSYWRVSSFHLSHVVYAPCSVFPSSTPL